VSSSCHAGASAWLQGDPTGPCTGGKGVKGEAEPYGTTLSCLCLPGGSHLQLHHQLHGRSRPAAPRLAGLRVELELLLEPYQTCQEALVMFVWIIIH
jgi:hypothetical protein